MDKLDKLISQANEPTKPDPDFVMHVMGMLNKRGYRKETKNRRSLLLWIPVTAGSIATIALLAFFGIKFFGQNSLNGTNNTATIPINPPSSISSGTDTASLTNDLNTINNDLNQNNQDLNSTYNSINNP